MRDAKRDQLVDQVRGEAAAGEGPWADYVAGLYSPPRSFSMMPPAERELIQSGWAGMPAFPELEPLRAVFRRLARRR
jgi:hypothetical protein